jgi:hypothetical protein
MGAPGATDVQTITRTKPRVAGAAERARLRQSSAMKAMRADWPGSFPDMAIHQTNERVGKTHVDYASAKCGDFAAAVRTESEVKSLLAELEQGLVYWLNPFEDQQRRAA